MKQSLTRTELTGLILLVILLLGITAAALMMQRCTRESEQLQPSEVMVVDSSELPFDEKSGSSSYTKKHKSGKKRGGTKKSSGKSTAPAVTRVDPFSDTIPMEYEE